MVDAKNVLCHRWVVRFKQHYFLQHPKSSTLHLYVWLTGYGWRKGFSQTQMGVLSRVELLWPRMQLEARVKAAHLQSQGPPSNPSSSPLTHLSRVRNPIFLASLSLLLIFPFFPVCTYYDVICAVNIVLISRVNLLWFLLKTCVSSQTLRQLRLRIPAYIKRLFF